MTIRTTTNTQVRNILKYPLDSYEWTVQGLGMIRLYLDAEHNERLHIWDPAAAVAEVSPIHDHPWDFDSRIVVGTLLNQRYILSEQDTGQFNLHSSKLLCGVGAHTVGEQFQVGATRLMPECYTEGDRYHQDAPEFHESIPSPGTVTVINRTFHKERDEAQVCWYAGDWVSAEPRPATKAEITHFTGLALKLL